MCRNSSDHESKNPIVDFLQSPLKMPLASLFLFSHSPFAGQCTRSYITCSDDYSDATGTVFVDVQDHWTITLRLNCVASPMFHGSPVKMCEMYAENG